jgi:hypothetical protein
MDWTLTRIVDNARIRLAALALDTHDPIQREDRRITAAEHLAIGTLLEELHRLNSVVNQQRQALAAAEADKLKPLQELAAKGSKGAIEMLRRK